MTDVVPAEVKGCYQFITLTVGFHRLIQKKTTFTHLLLDSLRF